MAAWTFAIVSGAREVQMIGVPTPTLHHQHHGHHHRDLSHTTLAMATAMHDCITIHPPTHLHECVTVHEERPYGGENNTSSSDHGVQRCAIKRIGDDQFDSALRKQIVRSACARVSGGVEYRCTRLRVWRVAVLAVQMAVRVASVGS